MIESHDEGFLEIKSSHPPEILSTIFVETTRNGSSNPLLIATRCIIADNLPVVVTPDKNAVSVEIRASGYTAAVLENVASNDVFQRHIDIYHARHDKDAQLRGSQGVNRREEATFLHNKLLRLSDDIIELRQRILSVPSHMLKSTSPDILSLKKASQAREEILGKFVFDLQENDIFTKEEIAENISTIVSASIQTINSYERDYQSNEEFQRWRNEMRRKTARTPATQLALPAFSDPLAANPWKWLRQEE